MYIIRRDKDNEGRYAFYTFEGVWVRPSKQSILDLKNVMRFTKGEAITSNLNKGESFVWFGCYHKLSRSRHSERY